MKNKFTSIILLSSLLFSCKNENKDFDASGTFETVETIISAEANGKILSLTLNEGDELKASQVVGYIDSTQLCLNRDVLIQNQKAVLSGQPDIATQIDASQKELDNAISDRNRIANLVKGEVASQKQLDDADARVATIRAKIVAQKNTLQTSSNVITVQGSSVAAQLNQVNDQISKCRITNPINGTALIKYTEANEMVSLGKPLYKIADLSVINLRAYITAGQFVKVKIGDKVKVSVDAEEGKSKMYDGVVEWINNKAEFTPKTIQTKDERANLVYAIKIRVQNDGLLKIGMYGEVTFN